MLPVTNRVPSSPHSDTAANIHSNPPSAGQRPRPLSVPPTSSMIDRSYQRGELQHYNHGNLSQQPPTPRSQQIIVEEMEVEDILEEDRQQCQKKQSAYNKDESKIHLEETTLITMIGSGQLTSGRILENVTTELSGIGENSPSTMAFYQNVTTSSIDNHSLESQSPSKSAITVERRSEQLKSLQEKEEERQQAEMVRKRLYAPVVLDCHSLEKAMLQPTSADEPSPLEQFLFGKNFLARLYPFFELAEKEARNRERGKLNLPVKEVHWAQGILTAKFLSYPMTFSTSASPGQQHQFPPCPIRLQLFICPEKFRLRAKLEYSGNNCPADSDVYIFERFFANQVSRINNELAVFAFITLCRLSSPTIYASLAQLMLAQMEKPQHYPWRIEFELLHLTEQQLTTTTAVAPLTSGQKAHQSQPQKNVQISVQVTDMCKQFLLILYLRPNHQQTSLRGLSQRVDKRRLIFRYNVERNELTLFTPQTQQMSESDQHIANVLKAQTELVNIKQQQMNIGGGGNSLSQSQPQCCIWSCIRALLEGQHVPLTANLPSYEP